jgi:hypothetical protein
MWAKVICFVIKHLGDWCSGILPNQEVFFRVSLEVEVGMAGGLSLVRGSIDYGEVGKLCAEAVGSIWSRFGKRRVTAGSTQLQGFC